MQRLRSYVACRPVMTTGHKRAVAKVGSKARNTPQLRLWKAVQ